MEAQNLSQQCTIPAKVDVKLVRERASAPPLITTHLHVPLKKRKHPLWASEQVKIEHRKATVKTSLLST
jgi:hypothetical protein